MSSALEPAAPTAGVKASLGRRVGAYAIDMVPFALIGAIAGSITMVISLSAITTDQHLSAALPAVTIIQTVGYALTFAWWLVVTIMQGGSGSVGQRMCGISLQLEATGGRIGFWRAALRNIVFAASCVIVVGYFTPLFDAERHRGWHDQAAGAMMVDNRASAAAAVPAPVVAAPAANPFLAPPAGAPFGSEPLAAPAATSFAPVAAPAPASGASLPVERSGMISAVPGVNHAAATPPAPPIPSVPEVTRPESAADDGVDQTRTMLRHTRPAAIVALTWDDGTRISVQGRTLFGRNPERQEGSAVIPVRDETLSLSKTHFAIDGDQDGAFITDLDSTNGTGLVRSGVREKLAPGVRVALQPGDRLEFGDRYALVARP